MLFILFLAACSNAEVNRDSMPVSFFDVNAFLDEYLSDIPAALTDIHRALKPGGRVVISDMDFNTWHWASEDEARSALLLGLSKAHIVKMSEDEVAFLCAADNLDKAIETLWHDDLKLFTVTRGGAGCRFFTPAASATVEALPVTVLDTTGAGDGFVAGLLQGIVKDPSVLQDPARLSELCRFANAAGALTTTRYGAIPALPSMQQVNEFLGDVV